MRQGDQINRYGDYLSGAAERVGRQLNEKGVFGESSAREAALAGDLFHPRLWSAWQQASKPAFERGLELLGEEEVGRLGSVLNQRGWNWVVTFAMQPQKLRALRERGLDPSAKMCCFEASGALSEKMEAAVFCCWDGWVSALDNMRAAGFKPPGRLDPGAGGREGASSPLQALASRAQPFQLMDQEMCARAVGWLCSSDQEGTGLWAVNERGEDALKMAVRAGGAEMAEVLMNLGARASDRNRAGQTAWDALREAQALAAEQDNEWVAKKLALLEPRLRSEMEREELALAAGSGPDRGGARLRV